MLLDRCWQGPFVAHNGRSMHLRLKVFSAAVLVFGVAAFGAPTVQTQRPDGSVEDMSRHSFLFAGQKSYILKIPMIRQVTGGRIAFGQSNGWDRTRSSVEPDYNDATVQSNGDMLFAQTYVAAVSTHQREGNWRYVAPPDTEIHSIQRIGKDRVLIMQNGSPA